MILIIRISGLVDMASHEEQMLHRLGLRRKYSAVLMKETKENLALLNRIRNFVAYGPVNQETLKLLVEKRAQPIDKKKVDAGKIVESLEKKDLKALGLKPFFRLHPPIGGIDSKVHFGRKKGVLGNNKEKINDLVRRML